MTDTKCVVCGGQATCGVYIEGDPLTSWSWLQDRGMDAETAARLVDRLLDETGLRPFNGSHFPPVRVDMCEPCLERNEGVSEKERMPYPESVRAFPNEHSDWNGVLDNPGYDEMQSSACAVCGR